MGKKEQGEESPNRHRRRIVNGMFYWLLIGIGILVVGLLLAAYFLGQVMTSYEEGKIIKETGTTEFVQGVVFSSLSGAIAGLLTYMGIIVKGIVDNLGSTGSGNDQGSGDPKPGSPQSEQST